MGEATAATHLIFFIVALAIAVGVVAVVNTNVQQISGATIESAKVLSNQLRTDITVINDPETVPNTGTNYTFYVKNTGKTMLATNLVTVMVDGSFVPTNNTTITILDGESMWDTANVIQIDADLGSTLSPGKHRVNVVVENGVSDTLEFEV